MARPKTNLILDDITVNINTAVKKAAEEIGLKLADAYKYTAQWFYKDYDGTGNNDYSRSLRKYSGFVGSYDRTYSLFTALEGVAGKGKYHKQIKKNYYKCGIRVGSEFMDGDPYIGQHHAKSMMGVVTAQWVFDRFFDKGIHGYTAAEYHALNRRHNYTLNWPEINKMSPSPQKMMKDKYKEITRDVYSYIEKYIK